MSGWMGRLVSGLRRRRAPAPPDLTARPSRRRRPWGRGKMAPAERDRARRLTMFVLEPMKPPSARQTSDLRWTRGAAICLLWGLAGEIWGVSAFGLEGVSSACVSQARIPRARRRNTPSRCTRRRSLLTLADARDTGALAETRLAAIILADGGKERDVEFVGVCF